MRENRTSGSVRGALGNRRSYREIIGVSRISLGIRKGKNMKKIVFIMMMMFVMNSSLSYAESVKVTTLPNYAPFCFHKQGREGVEDDVSPGKESSFFQGMAWDILKESYHAMGYTVHLTVVPWNRAMTMMDHGRADIIFPAVKTSEREEHYSFSQELSYPPNRFLVYAPQTTHIKWNGLASLDGKVVGIVRGFSYGKTWEEYIETGTVELYEYSDVKRGFLMLEHGRLDAVVGYELSYDYLLTQWGWDQKYTRFPPFDESRSFLMGKKTPHVKNLLRVFDEGKRKLRHNGRLKQIMIKWGFEHVTHF
jgi:polar amino acid transport system substrate-binding protein